MDINSLYVSNPIFAGRSESEYLPKWAMEEHILNCENSWREFRKDFFLKRFFSSLF